MSLRPTYIRKDLQPLLGGESPFAALQGIEGETYRSVPGRRTVRFSAGERHYFLKQHNGVGWREILKNLVVFKKPVVSAATEYEAILRLQSLGIDTLQVAAFAERGWNPARRQSFLITDELVHTVSLEDWCKDWPLNPPSLTHKRALIAAVADVARQLHAHAVYHRDFYLCHFLLHLPDESGLQMHEQHIIRLSLIDLHRVLQLNQPAQRWQIKDLAGLLSSSVDIGLSRRDRLYFIRCYYSQPEQAPKLGQAPRPGQAQRLEQGKQRDRNAPSGWKTRLREQSAFWQKVERRAQHTLLRDQRRFWRKKTASLYQTGAESDLQRVQQIDRLALFHAADDGPGLRAFINTPEMLFANGSMLKDGDTTTVKVVQLDGRECVVKRYNLISLWHHLRRLLPPSRAWYCWRNAHMLEWMGVATARPVLMLEMRWGPLRRVAYFVTEKVAAENLLVQGAQVADNNGAFWQPLAQRLQQLLTTLHRHRVIHGDMKASNLLYDGEQLVLLDLDAMRQEWTPAVFDKYMRRDVHRLLMNWRENENIQGWLRPELAPLLNRHEVN